MAALCRSVCGLTRLLRSDGQVRAASRTCFLTIRSLPSRLKRRLRLLANDGSSGAPPRSRSHSDSAPTLSLLQRGRPFLATLAAALDMPVARGGENHVGDVQADEHGDPEAGLQGDQQQA